MFRVVVVLVENNNEDRRNKGFQETQQCSQKHESGIGFRRAVQTLNHPPNDNNTGNELDSW